MKSPTSSNRSACPSSRRPLKAALDIDWGDAEQKQQALQRLCEELDALQTWIEEDVPVELTQPPLAAAVETLHTLMAQDLEPDPTGGGARIRAGSEVISQAL